MPSAGRWNAPSTDFWYSGKILYLQFSRYSTPRLVRAISSPMTLYAREFVKRGWLDFRPWSPKNFYDQSRRPPCFPPISKGGIGGSLIWCTQVVQTQQPTRNGDSRGDWTNGVSFLLFSNSRMHSALWLSMLLVFFRTHCEPQFGLTNYRSPRDPLIREIRLHESREKVDR